MPENENGLQSITNRRTTAQYRERKRTDSTIRLYAMQTCTHSVCTIFQERERVMRQYDKLSLCRHLPQGHCLLPVTFFNCGRARSFFQREFLTLTYSPVEFSLSGQTRVVPSCLGKTSAEFGPSENFLGVVGSGFNQGSDRPELLWCSGLDLPAESHAQGKGLHVYQVNKDREDRAGKRKRCRKAL